MSFCYSRDGNVLNGTNPCSKEFLPAKSRGQIYVLYIKQEHIGDYSTWTHAAKCFGLWDIDGRGVHKQMWTFWRNQNRLFIVGTSSPYAKYKPSNVLSFSLQPGEKADKEKHDRVINNIINGE